MVAPGAPRRRGRRRARLKQAGATLLACSAACCGAALLKEDSAWNFAGGSATLPAARLGASSRQAADPEKPWKSVVFKMPRKKAERKIESDDDAYTLQMRKRLKELEIKPDNNVGETRGVNEAKVDDLISKETDDAKINGLYAMWYIDKANDRIKAETENPDKHVMRKRYQAQKDKLLGVIEPEPRPASRRDDAKGQGTLNLFQDEDALVAKAALHGRTSEPQRAVPLDAGTHISEKDDDIVEYLTAMQKKAQREDRGSRRVVKSKEQRREDYEETKEQIYATTAALGLTGSLGFYLTSGVDAAFSFGLGSLAALSYLSGLSSYTDNADNPMGQVLGGRRFLSPILLVLLVQGWDRVEARIDAVAALGLHPQLLPAILGLLMYSLGKVLQGLLPKGEQRAAAKQ